MSRRNLIAIKTLLHLACLLPLLMLVYRGWAGELGANPIETVTHSTGTWALSFLLISLTITPLRNLKQLNWTIRLRRMLGLYAFFYACLHFATYVAIDQGFDWHAIGKDIAKRPYVTIGFSAFVLLLPLALTSTKAAIRRLTGHRWNLLHRLVYAAVICAVIHYWWLVKADIRTPALFGLATAVLLGFRLAAILIRSKRSTSDQKPKFQTSA